jgi:hypothetical protein
MLVFKITCSDDFLPARGINRGSMMMQGIKEPVESHG